MCSSYLFDNQCFFFLLLSPGSRAAELPVLVSGGWYAAASATSLMGLTGLLRSAKTNLCYGAVLRMNYYVNRKRCCISIYLIVGIFCIFFFIGCALVATERNVNISRWGTICSLQASFQEGKNQLKPIGSETLPLGIITRTTNLAMQPLVGSKKGKHQRKPNTSKNLLAMAVGIKQKETVDQIVQKFISSDFIVMLFHYDGIVDEWRDLQWCDDALHVSAINQTKWWFAKRFLHPDIVAEYNYIFLWDEDLRIESFHPRRYLSIIQEEGLEISQPALDTTNDPKVHHRITVRQRRNRVHRRFVKLTGGGRCYWNSTGPPCAGWVEMMAPVFSRAAWRCTWYIIQNDLVHAWGLDFKLGYCAQGDRTRKVGIVDSEYIVHKAIPSLGGLDTFQGSSGAFSRKGNRLNVRKRSYAELETFKQRWNDAVEKDKSWIDPYS